MQPNDDDLSPEECVAVFEALLLAGSDAHQPRGPAHALRLYMLAGRFLRHAQHGGMRVLVAPTFVPEWLHGAQGGAARGQD